MIFFLFDLLFTNLLTLLFFIIYLQEIFQIFLVKFSHSINIRNLKMLYVNIFVSLSKCMKNLNNIINSIDFKKYDKIIVR
jgi:hypothetical protein